MLTNWIQFIFWWGAAYFRIFLPFSLCLDLRLAISPLSCWPPNWTGWATGIARSCVLVVTSVSRSASVTRKLSLQKFLLKRHLVLWRNMAFCVSIRNRIKCDSHIFKSAWVAIYSFGPNQLKFMWWYILELAMEKAAEIWSWMISRTARKKVCLLFTSAIDNYKVGAAGDVFVMNSPGTMFPSAIISKLMAYSAGSVADLVEVNIYLNQ